MQGPFLCSHHRRVSAKDELEGMTKEQLMAYLMHQTDDDDIKLPSTIAEAILDMTGRTEEETNLMGFGLRCTKSGSILKTNFLDYIIHFIKQLPTGQGPDGCTVFLVMDYHGS